MSYCTTTDIQALNPTRTYSATSKPTLTQVQTYIDQIAGEIDSILKGRGLATPITIPAEFVTFLKQLNAVGAAALAERAMFPEAQGMMGSTSASAMHWRQYQDGIKWLKEGQMPSDVDGDGTALPFSFFSDSISRDTEPKDDYDWQRPKFGKNKEF